VASKSRRRDTLTFADSSQNGYCASLGAAGQWGTINRMKAIPILLALVVVLGCISEAGASSVELSVAPSYTVSNGTYSIGISDLRANGEYVGTQLLLGPLGNLKVPFTAAQGLIGFCVIVVGLLALVTAGTMRWKRKRAVPNS
jgi:hypothetical protein